MSLKLIAVARFTTRAGQQRARSGGSNELMKGTAQMGFTPKGIAANSLGASMMSAEAVASGGGVNSEGLVATLQSAGTGNTEAIDK